MNFWNKQITLKERLKWTKGSKMWVHGQAKKVQLVRKMTNLLLRKGISYIKVSKQQQEKANFYHPLGEPSTDKTVQN